MPGKRLSLFAAALWWGSLTAVGGLVVPLLFAHLPSKALAGQMAAQLFAAQTWVSVACGIVVLLVLKEKSPHRPENQPAAATIFIVTGLLVALLSQYGVAPRIVSRENLPLWHGVGSALYLIQWLCATALLWRHTPASAPPPSPPAE